MERTNELKKALANEWFSDVFYTIEELMGEEDVHKYIYLPKVAKVKSILKDYDFSIYLEGEKWLMVETKKESAANWKLCDKLEEMGFYPSLGNCDFNFNDFIY